MAVTTGRALIIDTDGGADDLLAISALRNTNSANIPVLLTVGGIQASPARAARFMKQVLVDSDVIPGQRSKINKEISENYPDDFLWLKDTHEKLNTMMNLAGVQYDEETDDKNAKTSGEIAKFLVNQPDQSVDLMCLGPMTNVASWIECEETRLLLEAKVAEIWIMGGNKPTRDLNKKNVEFNFRMDPTSTAEFLRCESLNHRMHIVDKTICRQQTPPDEKWKELIQKGKSREGIIKKVLETDDTWGSLGYDPICAFSYARPNERKEETLEVKIDQDTGLLYQPESGESDILKIKFVTEYNMDGFLSWIDEAIEAESL